MERLKELDRYQKGILIFLAILILVFTPLYAITISRTGFSHKGEILIPYQENGATIYSGKIHDTPAVFSVSADKIVTFQYGTKLYGPYQAIEDPSAIPPEKELSPFMTGIELRCGEEILFRGGVLEQENFRWLYSQDGNFANTMITIEAGNGTYMTDGNGNIIDPISSSPIQMILRGSNGK